MRQISKSVFLVITIIAVVIFTLSVTGLRSSYGDRTTNIINGAHQVPRGFGLENKAVMNFQLNSDVEADMNFSAIKKVIEKRLEYSSVIEYEVYPDYWNNGFSIVLPLDSEVSGNIGVLGQVVAAQGLFELREGSDVDEDGHPVGITENVVLTSEHIDYVRPMTATESLQGTIYYLQIELNRTGKNILTERAKQMLAEVPEEEAESVYFSLWINDTLHDYYSATGIVNARSLTSFSDSGMGYSMQEATVLAISLTGGYMPVPLRLVDIYADHSSAYAGDNTLYILITAFLVLLAAAGVFLIIRYKGIGAAGFSSIVLLQGILFLFATAFYGDVSKMQFSTASFGGFAVIILLSTLVIVRDGEAAASAVKNGISPNKAIASAFENSLTSSIVLYSSMTLAGLLIMDIFKRTGGISASLLKFFFERFSTRRYNIIYDFGRLMFIGGIAGLLIMVVIYRVMVRSAMSFRSLSNISLSSRITGRDFGIPSKKFIYIIIAAVVIAAGSFLSFTAGFGRSMENSGGYVLTARITRDYSYEDVTRDEINRYILGFFEPGAELSEGEFATYYYEMISVYSEDPITIEPKDLIAGVNEKYEGYLTEDSGAVYFLQKSFTYDNVNTFMISFAILILAAFILVLVTMGLKCSLIAVSGMVINALLDISMMVFLRIPGSSVIFTAVAVSVVIGFIMSLYNISVYNNVVAKTRKTNRKAVFNDTVNSIVVDSSVYSSVLLSAAAGFTVIGLIFSANSSWYIFTAVLFLSLLLPQFFSTFILPGLYETDLK